MAVMLILPVLVPLQFRFIEVILFMIGAAELLREGFEVTIHPLASLIITL